MIFRAERFIIFVIVLFIKCRNNCSFDFFYVTTWHRIRNLKGTHFVFRNQQRVYIDKGYVYCMGYVNSIQRIDMYWWTLIKPIQHYTILIFYWGDVFLTLKYSEFTDSFSHSMLRCCYIHYYNVVQYNVVLVSVTNFPILWK